MVKKPVDEHASSIRDRAVGTLVGLTVGDAIGTTLEFKLRDSYEHITDMVGGGPFGLEPGQWTDDTVGAVTGQLAGALWGVGSIPENWRRRLSWSNTIAEKAGALFDAGCSKYPGETDC